MLALTAILPPEALTRYDDHGEPKYTAIERVLITLRRFDWATAHDVLLALDRDPLGVGVNDNEHQALSRLARDGRVLRRREPGGRYLYKLNAAAFRRKQVARPGARRTRCAKCDERAAMGRVLCVRHLEADRLRALTSERREQNRRSKRAARAARKGE